MILGVTGGIATGKSTVSKMFQERGGILIDADRVARDVVKPATKGLQQIVTTFGEEVIESSGLLNREVLGKIVFQDKEKRKQLEKILHPLIRKEMLEKTAIALTNPGSIVIWDIPLLVEKKMFSFVDEVLLVYASLPFQIERLMLRNAFSRKEALARIQSQIPIEEKRKYADLIIDNQGSFKSTQEQVDTIWAEVTKKRRS